MADFHYAVLRYRAAVWPRWPRAQNQRFRNAYRPEIGSDKNPVLTRGEGQYLGVGNSFKPGVVRRKKIDCRLTAETPGDDRIVEIGIRQEADHPSVSPRDGLPPHTLKLHLDFRMRLMGSSDPLRARVPQCPLPHLPDFQDRM